MAHLSRDRGQLLLVGGIVVAFAIVGVAIVLNTVVLTDAIESREPPRDVDRAQEHAEIVEHAVHRVVEGNEFTEHPNWTVARENATRDVSRVGSLLSNRTLQSVAAHTDTTVNATRRGAVLTQTNESRNFTSAKNETQWKLATTNGIRNFTMEVDPLTSVNDTIALNDLPGFQVRVTGSGDNNWRAYLTATTDDDLRIVIQRGGETEIACVRTATTIDWTNGTVGGEPCGFTFASGLSSSYRLRYQSSDEATGTYHLVVSNTSSETVETDKFDDGSGDPRQYPAVYSLVVTATYDGEGTTRDTDIRIAPGEPEETRPIP